MKIVKDGGDPGKPWVGYQAKCSKCRCEFILETKDRVSLDERSPGRPDFSRTHYTVTCPNQRCRETVWIGLERIDSHSRATRDKAKTRRRSRAS